MQASGMRRQAGTRVRAMQREELNLRTRSPPDSTDITLRILNLREDARIHDPVNCNWVHARPAQVHNPRHLHRNCAWRRRAAALVRRRDPRGAAPSGLCSAIDAGP